MKKILLFIFLSVPSLVFADRLGSLNSNAQVLLSTQSPAAAGSNGQVQFNNSGSFGANSNFVWDGSYLYTTSGFFSGPYGVNASGMVTYDSGVSETFLANNGAGSMKLDSAITNGCLEIGGAVGNPLGVLTVQATTGNPAGYFYGSVSQSTPTVVVIAATSQSNKLIDFQNTSGASLVSVSSGGILTTAALKMTASPTNGYVLTSDGSGNASWAAAASGGTVSISTLTAGATNFIFNQNTLQTGATFYVSSGTACSFIVSCASTSAVPLRILSAASQTADLTDWTDSTGTFYLGVGNTGIIKKGSGAAITGEYIRGGNDTFLHSAQDHTNVFLGWQAGVLASSGTFNAGIGENALHSISVGVENSGLGANTLGLLQSGSRNLAMGSNCLASLIDGNGNMAMGQYSARFLQHGDNNVAIGPNTLPSATTASNEIAIGDGLNGQPTGHNIAIGYGVLSSNSYAGTGSIGIGFRALVNANSSVYNVSIGERSGENITSGSFNANLGALSGEGITTGSLNYSIGYQAGYTNATGSNNVFLGYLADVNADGPSNSVALGFSAIVSASNTNVIGAPGSDTILGDSAGYSAKMNVNTHAPSKKGVVVRASASQTANLQEFQDSSANIISGTDQNGYPFLPSVSSSTIVGLTPSIKGIQLYCTTCALTPVCVSTGTSMGQWSGVGSFSACK